MLNNLARIAVVVLMGLTLIGVARNPEINPEFPVNERNLSAPILDGPIHECALIVHVRGVMPDSIVRVFANGVEEVGKANPVVGETDVTLTRALVLNEVVTARQTVGAVTSDASDSLTVDPYPAKLSTPVPLAKIYACGRVVPVANLTPSTRVKVFDINHLGPIDTPIGTAENPGNWTPVVTDSLEANHNVNAVQVACPDIPAKTHVSPTSHPPLAISASPLPMPPNPTVDPVVIEGSETVVLHNLLPGAELEVKAGSSTVIATGKLATAPDNTVPVNPKVPPGHPKITATQKLCAVSAPSPEVIATDQLPPPRLRYPICSGTRIVALQDTIPNSTVVLFRRPAGGGSAVSVGNAGAVLGTLYMTLGLGATLNEGDTLFAIQYIGSIVSGRSNEVTVGCGGGANVVTQHNDNFRTGAYLAEKALTPSAVLRRKMVRLFKVNLSGVVVTQILYVRNVEFASGRANAVYAATRSPYSVEAASKVASVYALDADHAGNQKWRVDLKDSNPSLRPVALGIETTPVIDVSTNRIYVLFHTGNAAEDPHDFQNAAVNQAFWLVALDLRSGAELARTRVSAWVYDNAGHKINFSAKTQTAHPALLLDHGSLYPAFGSRADSEYEVSYYSRYHGWVIQYRASDLAQERVFCTSPNPAVRNNVVNPAQVAPGSGIWQGGGGLAADPNGSLFFLTGNGRFETNNALYGDAFLKLGTSGSTLAPAAWAPPIAAVDQLEVGDADLGSGGALVIPGTNLVIGGGKTGILYLLDRSSMQLVQQITGAVNHYSSKPPDENWESGPHLHGSPTFWQGTNFLYIWGEKDFLNAFAFNPATGKFSNAPVHSGTIAAQALTMPGGMLSLSANGTDPRTGIVWAIISTDNIEPGRGDPRGELLAFDAQTLGLLWSTPIGHTPHWGPPTIADGKVFVTNLDGELMAYALGEDPNDIHWTPYKPNLAYKKCQGCHGEPEVREFAQRTSLTKFYFNEARVFQSSAEAMHRLSQPSNVQKELLLEGSGTATYEAQANLRNGKLAWALKDTNVELRDFEPEPGTREDNAVPVRISPASVWTASDGSKITTRVLKSVPAPVSISVPWENYGVVNASKRGMLSGYTFIQRVQTHAGQAPAKRPRRVGEKISVRFTAEYWFYKRSRN